VIEPRPQLKKFQASKQTHSEASSAVASPALVTSPPASDAVPSPPRRPSLDLPHTDSANGVAPELQSTIDLLVAEKAHLSAQVSNLEGQLEQLEWQLAVQGNANKDNVAKLTAELGRARTQLQTAADRSKELEVDGRAAEERIASLVRRSSVSAAHYADLVFSGQEREAALKANELDETRADLAKASEDIAQLQDEMARGSSSQSMQSSQLQELQASLRHKSSHADHLEVELSKLRTASAALTVEALELDKQATEDEFHRLADDYDALQAAHADLQASTTCLRNEYEAHLSSVVNNDEELEQLRTDLTRSSKALTRAEDALAEARRSAEQALARRDGLQSDNEELMMSLAELRTKVVALTDETSNQQDRLEVLTRSLREKEVEVEGLQGEVDEARVRTGVLEGERDARATEVLELRATVQQAEREAAALQSAAAERDGQLRQLETKLQEVNADLAELQQSLATRETQLQEATASRDEALRETAEERHEKEVLATDVAGLQDRVEEYRKEVEEYKTEIEGLKAAQQEAEQAHQAALAQQSVPAFTPVPQTPFVASPFRRSKRHSVQSSVADTNGTEDWPSSEDEGQDHQMDAKDKRKFLANGQLDHAEALEADLSSSRERCGQLEGTVSSLEDKIRELNALIGIEREKTMKAMNEVFYLSNSISPSDFGRGASRTPSPGASPTPSPRNVHARPPALGHRRSASHLPTLAENIDGTLRANTASPISPAISPKGRTFRVAGTPRAAPDKAAIPAHARHARRQSLSHLKTRMEDELGLPNIQLVSATPTMEQTNFSPSVPTPVSASSHSPTRRSTKLGGDHIWCSHW
jgi:chromosome segregation ATPase